MPIQDSSSTDIAISSLPIKQLSTGVYALKLPLPFRGLDHVYSVLIKDNDGWVVVDAGFHCDEAKQLWQQVIKTVFQSAPITKIIITHYHPDHCGLSGWLASQFQAPPALYMSRTEWLLARLIQLDRSDEYKLATQDFYAQMGVPDALLNDILARRYYLNDTITPLPSRYCRLIDGMDLEIGDKKWQVLIGQGHSPEQVMLYNSSDNLLLAADQIMAKITPNISVWPIEPDENPVQDYIGTLSKLKNLPDNIQVFPFHGNAIKNLHQRIHDLELHHKERCNLILSFCRGGQRSGYQVCKHLFPKVEHPHAYLFALGETRAHLNYLSNQGSLCETFDNYTKVYSTYG